MGALGAHFAIFYLYLKVCGRWLDTSPLGYFEQHHLGTSAHKLSLPALRLELPERHRYFYSNQGSKPSQEGYFFLLGCFPDQILKKQAYVGNFPDWTNISSILSWYFYPSHTYYHLPPLLSIALSASSIEIKVSNCWNTFIFTALPALSLEQKRIKASVIEENFIL